MGTISFEGSKDHPLLLHIFSFLLVKRFHTLLNFSQLFLFSSFHRRGFFFVNLKIFLEGLFAVLLSFIKFIEGFVEFVLHFQLCRVLFLFKVKFFHLGLQFTDAVIFGGDLGHQLSVFLFIHFSRSIFFCNLLHDPSIFILHIGSAGRYLVGDFVRILIRHLA
eukprot:08058.XXX_473139_473627_1 [CDS] Oithona nana genome sequencing.